MADAGPMLSVRGTATQTVPPDYATFVGVLQVTGASKSEALTAATESLGTLTADLARLGAVPLDAAAVRAPLTWSARSATTHLQQRVDPATHEQIDTGAVIATVDVSLRIRTLSFLDDVGAVLAAHGALSIHYVSWQVDDDNPAWRDVRTSAITTAIATARDYAAAVGAAVVAVDHIADEGLLHGGGESTMGGRKFTALSATFDGSSGRTPSLDPVPQELTATIDARFVASPVDLSRI